MARTYCAGLLIDSIHQTLVLVQKSRPAWQAGYWNAPGGKIEAGETPVQAMRREMREETGIDLVEHFWTPLVFLEEPGVFQVHFFRALVPSAPAPAQMTDETVAAVRLDALPSPLVPHLRWVLALAQEDVPPMHALLNPA